MKESREPYTTFMASTRHHDMSEPRLHFVPALATDSTEIDRLHELPHGTKILEFQHRGAAVLNEMTKLTFLDGNPQNIAYLEEYAAPAPYNSQAYTHQGTVQVMNRQIPMPMMIDPLGDWQLTAADAKTRTMEAMNLSEVATSTLLYGRTINHMPQYKVREAGRNMAGSALWLANISLPGRYPSRDAFDTQFEVRARSLATVERSRTIGRLIGMIPSLGALGDIDSTYAAYLRRNAPNRTMRGIIAQSQEAYALAA